MNRREFLASSVGLLVSDLAFAETENPYRRLLVLVELKGGNDGLNTVVPYADGAYYRLRPRLALRRDEVLQLDERAALHPALKGL
ncbi:MAG TPA: Twin-arginine translocation pathway signal sequence domain-containing protein, partial [Burkholderiales bacterium]|nr:Twin-arginine translocation pathway signal sequence domain-containing protein [Burkholderiales bacterium]